jgi:hypothetical protein
MAGQKGGNVRFDMAQKGKEPVWAFRLRAAAIRRATSTQHHRQRARRVRARSRPYASPSMLSSLTRTAAGIGAPPAAAEICRILLSAYRIVDRGAGFAHLLRGRISVSGGTSQWQDKSTASAESASKTLETSSAVAAPSGHG